MTKYRMNVTCKEMANAPTKAKGKARIKWYRIVFCDATSILYKQTLRRKNNSTAESAARQWGSARQPDRVRFQHRVQSPLASLDYCPSRDYAIFMKS